MLKTISAALLAVSVLAAPALAAGTAKTATAPVTKTGQVKPSVLNAKAKMGPHQTHFRHHRSHERISGLKTHQSSKVATKHVGRAPKRG